MNNSKMWFFHAPADPGLAISYFRKRKGNLANRDDIPYIKFRLIRGIGEVLRLAAMQRHAPLSHPLSLCPLCGGSVCSIAWV